MKLGVCLAALRLPLRMGLINRLVGIVGLMEKMETLACTVSTWSVRESAWRHGNMAMDLVAGFVRACVDATMSVALNLAGFCIAGYADNGFRRVCVKCEVCGEGWYARV